MIGLLLVTIFCLQANTHTHTQPPHPLLHARMLSKVAISQRDITDTNNIQSQNYRGERYKVKTGTLELVYFCTLCKRVRKDCLVVAESMAHYVLVGTSG